jgi:hypothetical protein
MRPLHYGLAMSALLSIGSIGTLDPPKITMTEQRLNPYSTANRTPVSIITVGVNMGRHVWLTGPWLDHTSSVNVAGNVSAEIKGRKDLFGKGEVYLYLSAEKTAVRGVKTLSLNISCPVVAFDCNKGPVYFKVRVTDTGPISTITPLVVPVNSRVTFTLQGAGVDVAAILLTRITNLLNPVIVGRTTNTLSIQGTATACDGPIHIELRDKDDPYMDQPYRVPFPPPRSAPCVR